VALTPSTVWGVVIGMGVVNYLLRLAPLAVLSKVRLPRPIERWLSFIPVSVMSALVVGEVLHPNGTWPAPWANAHLLAAIPTGLVYLRTRSFITTSVLGIVFFVVIRGLMN
jgi:branched-subunit amino acid transport protein